MVAKWRGRDEKGAREREGTGRCVREGDEKGAREREGEGRKRRREILVCLDVSRYRVMTNFQAGQRAPG